MDIEYLECDVEFIDLADTPATELDEAAAEAVFANWFTDWRAHSEAHDAQN